MCSILATGGEKRPLGPEELKRRSSQLGEGGLALWSATFC